MDAETRNRLRVLWVLLNVSREIMTTQESCAAMEAIEKLDKNARLLWDLGFKIVSHDRRKILYEWPRA